MCAIDELFEIANRPVRNVLVGCAWVLTNDTERLARRSPKEGQKESGSVPSAIEELRFDGRSIHHTEVRDGSTCFHDA